MARRRTSTRKRVSFTLTGDAELNRALAAIKEKTAKDFVRKASREVLKQHVWAFATATPRRSGALSRDIKVRAVTRSRTKVGARITTGAGGLFRGKTFYGGFQEWGWKTGSRKSTSRRQIEGKRFLRNTADRKRDVIVAQYRERLRAMIEEEAASYL